MTFVEKAKLKGANALLGAYTHAGGYDSKLKDLSIVRMGGGEAVCELPVTKELSNAFSTLHGGAAATLVDVVGTLALLSNKATKPGVSVEINVSYASAAKCGTTVEITGRVTKYGKRLGFTQVDIVTLPDRQLVATGRHTKFLG